MKCYGRMVRRKPGEMNRLELAYSRELDVLKMAGEIIWYAFDALKFRLADATFYTPDFLVQLSDGSLEVHEVKGHWEDDARVKIKVAADKFPIKFKAIKRVKGQWITEEF